MRPPFHLPLDLIPEIVQVGTNTHGHLAVETYRHTDYWGFHLYAYAGALSFDGLRYPFRSGFASITPPRTDVSWHFPEKASHYYCLFRYGEAVPEERRVELPVTRDLGTEFPQFTKRLDEAMGLARGNPRHAAVVLADLLWRLSYRHAPAGPVAEGHPKLRAAVVHIETHLHRPIHIMEMAAFLGISATHLERLFRQATGSSIRAYLRRRRAEKAKHLLVSSSLPIPGIAKAVGIPDLHQFNKVLRRELGRSPRALRGGGDPTGMAGTDAPGDSRSNK